MDDGRKSAFTCSYAQPSMALDRSSNLAVDPKMRELRRRLSESAKDVPSQSKPGASVVSATLPKARERLPSGIAKEIDASDASPHAAGCCGGKLCVCQCGKFCECVCNQEATRKRPRSAAPLCGSRSCSVNRVEQHVKQLSRCSTAPHPLSQASRLPDFSETKDQYSERMSNTLRRLLLDSAMPWDPRTNSNCSKDARWHQYRCSQVDKIFDWHLAHSKKTSPRTQFKKVGPAYLTYSADDEVMPGSMRPTPMRLKNKATKDNIFHGNALVQRPKFGRKASCMSGTTHLEVGRNRREKTNCDGSSSIFKGMLWKLKQEGDLMKDQDWFHREHWINSDGSLVYYSKKEERNLVYLSAFELRRADITKIPESESVKPWSFRIQVPQDGGVKYAPGEFAADDEKFLNEWLDAFRSLKNAA
mmetsp:Transcript_57004/g.90307  ORF Transcript_57004/g.90307 Transcript_57004/m.90307 type:complete len:417 (+) Transcript_57004:61-1311(+)